MGSGTLRIIGSEYLPIADGMVLLTGSDECPSPVNWVEPARACLKEAMYGGQGQNRTADTGIFRRED